MWQVDEEDKQNAIPIMVKGDAMNKYYAHSHSCKTFGEAVELFRGWYHFDDRKARILTKRQAMTLSPAMEEDPEESEIAVFRRFTANLMSLQRQLDSSYHTDQFIRDRLLTPVDISSLQAPCRGRMPRTNKQAINRVSIQLRDRKRSAGSAAACTAEEEYEMHYSLDKKYGGAAGRSVKKPLRGSGRKVRRGDKRVSSIWMKGVKGCFVCGQDHRANNETVRRK